MAVRSSPIAFKTYASIPAVVLFPANINHKIDKRKGGNEISCSMYKTIASKFSSNEDPKGAFGSLEWFYVGMGWRVE